MALHEYEARHGHPPRPWHSHDANTFLEIFREVNEQRTRKAEEDERLVRLFAHTAAGQTAPLTSVVGGGGGPGSGQGVLGQVPAAAAVAVPGRPGVSAAGHLRPGTGDRCRQPPPIRSLPRPDGHLWTTLPGGSCKAVQLLTKK